MGIGFIFIFVVFLFVFFFSPFVGGWVFLHGGVTYLLNFDPEYDDPRKRWRAMLDIFFGIALLLFFHASFWLTLWPLLALTYNLPTFSW